MSHEELNPEAEELVREYNRLVDSIPQKDKDNLERIGRITKFNIPIYQEPVEEIFGASPALSLKLDSNPIPLGLKLDL